MSASTTCFSFTTSMANSNIILTKDFESTKVTYEEPRKLDNGGKMIYVAFNKCPIRIQTPQCYVPFGINVYRNEENNTESHTMDISFDGKDVKANLGDFYNKMYELDTLNVEKGFEYQQNWFRKKYPSKEVIEALYTTMIKYPKDKNGEISKEWSPTFKFKLPYVNGEYKFEMYDKNNKRMDVKDVQTKGARVVAILKCNGIWIAGGKFGMSWKAEQIQIIPPNRITGFAIKYIKSDRIQQEDSEEVVPKPKSKPKQKIEEEPFEIQTELEDSEDELEPKQEPEEQPDEEPVEEPEEQPEEEPEPEKELETEPVIESETQPVDEPEPEQDSEKENVEPVQEILTAKKKVVTKKKKVTT